MQVTRIKMHLLHAGLLTTLLVGLFSCLQKSNPSSETHDVVVGETEAMAECPEGVVALPALTDSLIRRLIEEHYTEQNSYDGSEFASVDSLLIRSVYAAKTDSSYIVKYYISCSYQSAALSEEYQSTPPSVTGELQGSVVVDNQRWKFRPY